MAVFPPAAVALAHLDLVSHREGHWQAAMLPAPVTLYEKRGSRGRSTLKTKDVLLARARVTNLGLILLLSCSALSFLFNLGFWLSSGPVVYPIPENVSPQSILATIERDRVLHSLDHLVIVPGHAVWKGTHPERALEEDNWILEPYQRGGGRVDAFYNHIMQG